MLVWLVIHLLGYGWVVFSKEESLIKIRSWESISTLVWVNVASKTNLFLFPSRRELLYKSISFLTLSEKDLKFSKIGFTLFIRSVRYWESDGTTEGNAMYLQFLNYKNIEDSCSLENSVETYANWGDEKVSVSGSKIPTL